MDHYQFKILMPLFLFTLPTSGFSSKAPINLAEGESLRIQATEHRDQAIYTIKDPGASSWVSNGRIEASGDTPACITGVYIEDLNSDQYVKIMKQLVVMTENRKLSLQEYKGTWSFVDEHPATPRFDNRIYTISTINNLSFGQVLESVGGKRDDIMFISFNRGCKKLAVSPYVNSITLGNINFIKRHTLKIADA